MPPRLLALIVPPLCGVCAEGCAPERPLCHACAGAIAAERPQPLVIPGTDSAWAATRYEGSPRALVAALKFNRRLALAGVAAEAIAASAPSTLAVTAVVPAPADPWRARLRGFDAADLIARSLGGLLGLPVCHCLGRRHAPRQVGKPRARRLRDAPRVQATMRPPAVPLLVDDVVTTGATLAAATSALRRAGCETVLAAAFARA